MPNKQLLKQAKTFLSEGDYWHGGNSNGDIPKAMAAFAEKHAADVLAAERASKWTVWDWDDVSTHPKESGHYLCGYGADTDEMVVDEWDAENGDFMHYGIYGIWMPLPKYTEAQ